jgi:RsfA family transcription factor
MEEIKMKTWTNYEDVLLASCFVESFSANKTTHDAIAYFASSSKGRTMTEIKARWDEVVKDKYADMINKALKKKVIKVKEEQKQELTMDVVIQFLQNYKKAPQDQNDSELLEEVIKLRMENQQLQEKYDKIYANIESLKKILN